MVPNIFHPSFCGQVENANGTLENTYLAHVIKGNRAEENLYNIIEEFGTRNKLGLFVVHGFGMKQIKEYYEMLRSKTFGNPLDHPTYQVLSYQPRSHQDGEFDFIIFCHDDGCRHVAVLVFEVKASTNFNKKEHKKGKGQLQRAKKILEEFCKEETMGGKAPELSVKAFIVYANRKRPFKDMKQNIQLSESGSNACFGCLYKDDISSADKFQSWWNSNIIIEQEAHDCREVYKRCLARVVGIRSLNLVPYFQRVATISHELQHQSFLDANISLQKKKSEKSQPIIAELGEFVNLNGYFWTPKQLAAFEGPKSQIIAGPAGSGKTLILLQKAITCARKLSRQSTAKKVLYLLASDSCNDYRSLVAKTYQFLVTSLNSCELKFIDIASIGFFAAPFSCQISCATPITSGLELKQAIDRGDYEHVFVDETQTSSPLLQDNNTDGTLDDSLSSSELYSFTELSDSVTGYIWLAIDTSQCDGSSHFYLELCSLYSQFTVVVLNETLRSSNNISNLWRKLVRPSSSAVTELFNNNPEADFLKKINWLESPLFSGHNISGPSVTWIIASTVNEKADACKRIISSIIRDDDMNNSISFRDICVIFYLCTGVKRLLEGNFPITTDYSLIDNAIFSTNEDRNLLPLLSKEFPIVLLCMNTTEIRYSVQSVQDLYICLSRAQVKLYVVSDTWRNEGDFDNFIIENNFYLNLDDRNVMHFDDIMAHATSDNINAKL